MENLIIKGKITVLGKEIPVIYGGFGDGQRTILAKTVALLHDTEIRTINQLINNHIEDGYFEEGIDFVDLKGTKFEVILNDNGIYTQNAINRSNNIYLLSQQGYTLLLKLMNTELARKQYKQVIRQYFQLEEAVKSGHQGINKIKQMEMEARLCNAKTRQAKELIRMADNPNSPLPSEYKHILYAKAAEIIIGQALIPLPVTEKTYSATEIAKECGVSANKIGRIANENGLKTSRYGVYVFDKSPYSNKQVETFRYNEEGRRKLMELIAREG
ncbi:MAG: ORF6N domain-containing protein [Archaeoglobus sp.]|nr:ORF6N domain-containing protein [Archaeoglobus sp.]